MKRRTDRQIKDVLKSEYSAMRKAGCTSRTITKAIVGHYNPRLIIEAIQEYNDELRATS